MGENLPAVVNIMGRRAFGFHPLCRKARCRPSPFAVPSQLPSRSESRSREGTANGDGAGSGWHSSQKPFCVLMEMNSMFAGSGFNPRLCHSLHHQLSSSNTALFFTDALTATKHAPEGQKESGRAFLRLLLLLSSSSFTFEVLSSASKAQSQMARQHNHTDLNHTLLALCTNPVAVHPHTGMGFKTFATGGKYFWAMFGRRVYDGSEFD